MLETNELTPATPDQSRSGWRFALHPKRYRRGLIRVLVPVLALLILAGPTVQLTSQRAAAQAAIISMQIDVCGGSGNFNYVIQDCELRSNGLADWEDRIIKRVMQRSGLPESERERVLTWERDSIRAMMFAEIFDAISKDDSIRTAEEKTVLAEITEIIQANRIAAAERSIFEYNVWNAHKCTYVAPAGFHYQIDTTSCYSQLGGLIATPRPPSLQDFLTYGATHVYGEYQLDPAFVASLTEMPRMVGFISAIILASTMGTPIVIFGMAGLVAAIQSFLAAAAATSASSVVMAGVAGAASAVAVAGTVFGVIASVILAIVIAVIHALAVFSDAAIPGQLQDNLNAAQATPDLRAMKGSDQGMRELVFAFLQLTFPVPFRALSVPAAQPTDPQFQITDAGNAKTFSSSIDYQCWNPVKCHDGLNHSARLSGHWFVDGLGQPNQRMTLGIDYIDWSGAAKTAWRIGDRFLHIRTGDNSREMTNSVIQYKDWNGANKTATIATPLTVAMTSGAPAEGSEVTFEIHGSHATGSGVTYSWDFGDGSPAVVGPEPTRKHTYTSGGTYTLTVTATGANANTIPPLTFLVSTTPPILTFDDKSFKTPEGTPITLTASAQALGNGGDVTISWLVRRYEPGFSLNFQPWIVGSGESFTFTPENGGSFGGIMYLPPIYLPGGVTIINSVFANMQVIVTATDSLGQTTTKSVMIEVTNVAPTINSLTTSNTLVEGNPIYITADTTDPGVNEQMTSEWSVTKNGQPYSMIDALWPVGFVPDDEGTYVVTYKLSDGDGGSDTHSETFDVQNVAPQIEGREVTIEESKEVLLRGSIYDPGTQDSFTLTIDWKDGSDPEVVSLAAGATEFEVPHTYLDDDPSGTASDDYVVSLEVADNAGATGTDTTTITVTNIDPTVELAVKRDSGEEMSPNDAIHLGDAITAVANYSDEGTLDTRTAVIDWGDGSTTNLGAVTDSTTTDHTYALAGTYTLTVTVTDDDTGVGQASHVVVVESPGMVLTDTVDLLKKIKSNNPRSGASLQPVILILDGLGGGQNSAANQLDSSRPELGLLRIRLALLLIAIAEAFNPSLDLTAVKTGLAEAARSATFAALIKAQTRAEADNNISASEQATLNRANALMKAGDAQLKKGNHGNAVNNYLITVATLVPLTR